MKYEYFVSYISFNSGVTTVGHTTCIVNKKVINSESFIELRDQLVKDVEIERPTILNFILLGKQKGEEK